MDKFRGHKIHKRGSIWVFSDINEPVTATRPCGHCGMASTPEGYDGCIGYLPGVQNACCGHGDARYAYIQFTNGKRVSKWIK